MQSNLLDEQLITLADYTRIRPPGRRGARMHIRTAYRHALEGVRGIKLETVQIGGRLFTSREAIARFAARLADRKRAPCVPATSAARHNRAASVIAAGIFKARPTSRGNGEARA
jgi:hypothetical protein